MDIDHAIRLAPAVSLEQMLDAREARVNRQRSLITNRPDSDAFALISFTLNIPGEYKSYPLTIQAFEEGCGVINSRLRRAGLAVIGEDDVRATTGCEHFWQVHAQPEAVKQITVAIEESHPLGRIWDIDVLSATGKLLKGVNNGRGERQCIVCGKQVWECSRSRAHPPEELSRRTALVLKDFFDGVFVDNVAALATRALLYEVNVTPKPGLVDRDNCGAHRDMDIFTFIDSSVTLTSFFRDCTGLAMRHRGDIGSLLPVLRCPGLWAEDRMFAATKGVNTHKGLIFSLGLLCAGLGLIQSRNIENTVDALLQVCARIAMEIPGELSELPEGGEYTNGRKAFEHFGVTGARGEAASGYPHLRERGFPVLWEFVERGATPNDAGVAALLHLLACVEDTNMIARSNYATLLSIQNELDSLLSQEKDIEGIKNYAKLLDQRFCEQWLSPGGSADLLALAFMLLFARQEGLLTG